MASSFLLSLCPSLHTPACQPSGLAVSRCPHPNLLTTTYLQIISAFSRIFVNLTECARACVCVPPSCSVGSRSPPSSSQPPAFFSKLTESTSAIVKSKKQEMIKKMTVVGNEGDFSKCELTKPLAALRRAAGSPKPCFPLQTRASRGQKSSTCQHPPPQVGPPRPTPAPVAPLSARARPAHAFPNTQGP